MLLVCLSLGGDGDEWWMAVDAIYWRICAVEIELPSNDDDIDDEGTTSWQRWGKGVQVAISSLSVGAEHTATAADRQLFFFAPFIASMHSAAAATEWNATVVVIEYRLCGEFANELRFGGSVSG
jgi:hypothetical protein